MTPIRESDEQPVDHEHHRMVDGEMHHFHHREMNGRHRNDTHQRWIVGVISMGMVGLLAFFAAENYRMVNSRIDDQKAALHNLVRAQQSDREAIVEMQTNQRAMMDTQKRIEDKLDLLIRKAR